MGEGNQAAGWGGERKSVMGRVVEVDKKVTVWTLQRWEELNVTAVSICY